MPVLWVLAANVRNGAALLQKDLCNDRVNTRQTVTVIHRTRYSVCSQRQGR
jgi:hypothetical protein